MIFALFLVSAAMAPQAVVPPVAKTTAPTDATAHDKAIRLAQTMCPESNLIDDSGNDYVAATRELLIERGKLNDLEARYPGVINAMLRASVTTMNRQMRRRVPVLWNRLADVYAAQFSSIELDQMLAFYGSPTGKRMIESLNNRMKPTAMLNEMKKNDDLSISLGSLQTDLKSTIPGVVSDMSAADKTALLAFMRTSAFGKISAITTTIQRITLNWAQESSPEDEKELEDLMVNAMQAYIKAKDAAARPTT